MAGISKNYANLFLADITGGTAFAGPSDIWVALFQTDPGNDGSGTEVNGSNYARVNYPTGWSPTVTGGTTFDNDTAITFNTASGSWGTVTHFGLFDASSGGNYIWGGSLSTPKSVGNTDVASFAAGALAITLQ